MTIQVIRNEIVLASKELERLRTEQAAIDKKLQEVERYTHNDV